MDSLKSTQPCGIEKSQADSIRHIAHEHGVVDIQIFGSRAMGKGTPTSDIDLLVELAPGRDLLDLIGLKQDLEAALGCPIDVVTRDGLSPYLKDRILREARPL